MRYRPKRNVFVWTLTIVYISKSSYCSSSFLLNALKWQSIVQIIEYQQCLMVYKILHDRAPSYLSTLILHRPVFYSTRYAINSPLFVPTPRTEYMKQSLSYQGSHYEPPGQNVSIVSQICLIFVSNCLKRSQFCLKHVSDKMSQFGLNLRPFWHLRHNWDCPYLRAIWEQFETFFCVVKKVSKRSQTCLKKGFGEFSGSMVDRWSFQVPSLYIQTLWFHN